MRTRLSFALALALTIGALATPSSARAQGYWGVGIGPAVRIDDWPNQFRFEMEVGFFTDDHRGFFLSFAPAHSFSRNFWVWALDLRLGFLFDVFRNDDVTFQLGPTGTVGFAVSDEFDTLRDPDPWFHLSIGFMMRFLVLNETLGFYLRPLDFEFAIGDSPRFFNEAIRYLLTGGFQLYF